ncbi:sulfatase [Lacipirellula parvula]|uniref:Arylsulfatase n=1 Tax=Lacipirellula parvula TaxID=2650471 RepID=A0A5K7XDD3_9BACT|nr:sulfatase [Lacipirellula parvula]BBO32841.1 arylsulfatase [Lacipirellula parvula]
MKLRAGFCRPVADRSVPQSKVTFMKGILAIACLALPTLAAVRIVAAATPNILLITSEDSGPQLGCYGDSFVRTPHLDRLAAEGIRFNRAFVATASCSESRAAILTGLYPHQNGQIGLAPYYRMSSVRANIPSILRAHGYRTGLIGKLHVNPESAFPFDYRPDVSECNSFTHRNVGKVAKLAEDFIRGEEAPFFLMVNYADAHLPFLRQQYGSPSEALVANDVRPLPWIGLDAPRLRECQADYYNCLMRLDDGVGELLSVLERTGQQENTLVIYLGDHGAQFPRGKLASYESSLHIPLLLRWPQQLPADESRSGLVSSIDILPTILEATAIPGPSDLPGRSLLSLCRDQHASWRNYLSAEYHAHIPTLYFPQRTIRDDRYKLIVNLLQDRPNPVAAAYTQHETPQHPSYVTPDEVAAGSPKVQAAYRTWLTPPPVELYDLQEDPYELHNRAETPELKDVKSHLLAALHEWRMATNDPLLSSKTLDRLTREHDSLASAPQTLPHEWRYHEYFASGDKDPPNKVDALHPQHTR